MDWSVKHSSETNCTPPDTVERGSSTSYTPDIRAVTRCSNGYNLGVVRGRGCSAQSVQFNAIVLKAKSNHQLLEGEGQEVKGPAALQSEECGEWGRKRT